MLRSAKSRPRDPLTLLKTFFTQYQSEKWQKVGDVGKAVEGLKAKNAELVEENEALRG